MCHLGFPVDETFREKMRKFSFAFRETIFPFRWKPQTLCIILNSFRKGSERPLWNQIEPEEIVNPRCRLFKIWMELVNNNPEAETQRSFARRRRITRQRKPVLRRLRETPLSFCLRVIVNEFHPNLEKMTSSVQSVILINLC